MRYLGGKTRHAKAILNHIDKPTTRYVEPFVGGGSALVEAVRMFPNVEIVGSDYHEGLVAMWRAGVFEGWEPPETLTEDQYQELREGPDNPLKTYASFACSFGGKEWGGFARDKTGVRDLSTESYRRVSQELSVLRGHPKLELHSRSYEDVDVHNNDVVYCDPPYRGTTGYRTGQFDHEKFDSTVESWVESGASVFVSEFNAPDHWEVVWTKTRKTDVGGLSKTEKLYKVVPR